MDFGPLVQSNSPGLREIQPAPGVDLGRPGAPQIYPQLPSHESAIGEYFRVLIKRSDGITGRVTWLLACAAEIAIQDGSEFIDAAVVERVCDRLRIDPS